MFPERLTQGYRAFLDGRFADERSRYEMLAEKGQRPEIMVVGCVDSRVSPEVIFDAAPGELLVVRNVANIVPRYEPDRDSQHGTSAALEFGVKSLGIKDVIVMGHAGCGGIEALHDGARGTPPPGDFVPNWISLAGDVASQVIEKHGDLDRPATLRLMEQQAVVASLDRLRTFPFIAERERKGELRLHGWFYGIGTGILSVYDADRERFVDVIE